MKDSAWPDTQILSLEYFLKDSPPPALDSLGVDFVSVTEAIDTSTPAGKMVFTVLGAVAELERAIIRERVIAGQKAAKRRGVRFGRPNVAVPLAQVERLRQKGLSWRVLEAQTGVAKDTLRRAFMALQARSRSRT